MTHTHGFFSDEIINPWTGGKFNLSEEAEDNAAQDGKFFSVWGYSWPNLCLLSLSLSFYILFRFVMLWSLSYTNPVIFPALKKSLLYFYTA